MTNKPVSQFGQLQAIARDLIARDPGDYDAIRLLQGRARAALKTPVGNRSIAEAQKKSVASRKASAEAFKAQVQEHIQAAKASGSVSLRQIAAYLNDNQVPPRRGTRWLASTVARVLQ